MAEDKAPYTSLLADHLKTSMGSLDLFDRIINVRLVFMEAGDDGKVVRSEFVIRSDFETYFPDMLRLVTENKSDDLLSMNKCYVRKCQYKPSVKIQYKRVSMDVPIEIDLFMENFFLLDKNGRMLKTFNNATNAIVQVDIAMGYYGQFYDCYAGKGGISSMKVSDLFNFDRSKLAGHGITMITISNVVYVQTDKLPPDMTVHIHGFVGNLYSEKLLSIDRNKEKVSYDEVKDNVIRYSPNSRRTFLEEIFFQKVTRNWARQGDLPDDIMAQVNPDRLEQRTIKDVLSEADAKQWGVQVYFSRKAKEFAEKYDEEHVTRDSDGNKVYPSISIPTASTALQKANAVKTALGMSEFISMPLPSTGDILLYLEDETLEPDKMWEGTPVQSIYETDGVAKFWENKIPAVYNITTDALCTVVCPFFFFIDPFQVFYFKTRYALGGLVSYYANFNASEDEFYALWQNVSFATVEDINECTIVCTGRRS